MTGWQWTRAERDSAAAAAESARAERRVQLVEQKLQAEFDRRQREAHEEYVGRLERRLDERDALVAEMDRHMDRMLACFSRVIAANAATGERKHSHWAGQHSAASNDATRHGGGRR